MLLRDHLLHGFEILAGQRVLGIERECPLKVLLGLSQVAQLRKRAAQVRLGIWILRIQPNGLAKLLSRAAEVSLHRISMAKVVVCVEIVGARLERSLEMRNGVVHLPTGQ